MLQQSTLLRKRRAAALARLHYESGNQSRSLKQVWRRYAQPELGICYHTFLRYLKAESQSPLSP